MGGTPRAPSVEAGWVDRATLSKVLDEVAYDSGRAHDLGDTVVPSFMECAGFSSWPALQPSAGTANLQTYEATKSNVKDLCR